MPDNLKELVCERNQLTVLPALPDNLKELVCERNQLTVLPDLPVGLSRLICNDNQLTALPALPESLKYIQFSGNNIIQIGDLSLNIYIKLNIDNLNYSYLFQHKYLMKTNQNQFVLYYF